MATIIGGNIMNRKKLSRNIKYSSNSFIFTAAVIGIVIIINLIIRSFHIQWDLTSNKIYTLSEEGINALKKLDQDVSILFFANPADPVTSDIQQLYENMATVTNHISLEIIDPLKNPSLVNQYQITTEYSAVVSSEKMSKQVHGFDIIRTDYSTGEYFFDGEGALIQAILDVTADKQTQLYVLEGHGEFSLDENLTLFKYLLEQKGVKVHSFTLTTSADLPGDSDIICILGPLYDYTPNEIEILKDFLDKGGKVILAFNDYQENENLDNLKNFAQNYGIKVENIPLSNSLRHYAQDERALVPVYTSHEIVQRLEEDNIATIIPNARKLSIEKKEDIINRVVLETSQEEAIAITAEKYLDNDETAQLLVIGNAFFLHDQAISLGGNSDIVLGALTWFKDDESIVNIKPKTYSPEPIVLVGIQSQLIFLVCVVLIPLFVFIFGLMLYLRRRTL